MSDGNQAAQRYQQGLFAWSQHHQAAEMSMNAAVRARESLELADPTHDLLAASPEELAAALGQMNMSPLAMMVEIFLRPEDSGPVRGARPDSVLLAGSMAIGQAGPGTASVPTILERVNQSLRGLGIERAM